MPNPTYELLESYTLGSTTSSITFGSGGTLSQAYKDLQIMIKAQVAGYSSVDGNVITLNGSSANITMFYFDADANAGSPVIRHSSLSANTFTGYAQGTGLISTGFSQTKIFFPNYTGSAIKAFTLESCVQNDSSSFGYIGMVTGKFASTSAITSITLAPPSGASGFAANSVFDIYGIKNS